MKAHPKVNHAWLVQQRSQIQTHCLHLHTFGDDHRPELDASPFQEVYTLLLGSAFSLWRAVFIAPEETPDRSAILESARTFMKTLIETNTIVFSNDRNAWSFGYYRNNAYFRLRAACEILGANQVRIELDLPVSMADLYDQNPMHAWDKLFAAQESVWNACQTLRK